MTNYVLKGMMMKNIVLSTLVVLLSAGCVGTAKLAKESSVQNSEQVEIAKPSIKHTSPNHKE